MSASSWQCWYYVRRPHAATTLIAQGFLHKWVDTISSGTSTIQAANYILKLRTASSPATSLHRLSTSPRIRNQNNKHNSPGPYQSSDTINIQHQASSFLRVACIRYTAWDFRNLAYHVAGLDALQMFMQRANVECRMNATLKPFPECLLQEYCACPVHTCPSPCKPPESRELCLCSTDS